MVEGKSSDQRNEMRILGLDVGQKRIGLGVGETTGRVATPVPALDRTVRARDVEAVLRQARKQNVERIVVGIPYSLDGSLGPWGRSVMALYEALKAASPIPVESWDERFSTVDAQREMQEGGAQPSRNRGKLDSASAAVMLQSYMAAIQERKAIHGSTHPDASGWTSPRTAFDEGRQE